MFVFPLIYHPSVRAYTRLTLLQVRVKSIFQEDWIRAVVTSGARYSGVPQNVFMVAPSVIPSLHRPKSVIFMCPSLSSIRFSSWGGDRKKTDVSITVKWVTVKDSIKQIIQGGDGNIIYWMYNNSGICVSWNPEHLEKVQSKINEWTMSYIYARWHKQISTSSFDDIWLLPTTKVHN